MDEQTEKELKRELELAYQRLEKIKAKITPDLAEAIKKAVQPQLEELITINENMKKAFEKYPIYDQVQGTINRIGAMYEDLAQAALETQRVLMLLGVETGSINDAVQLFKPEAAGAFIGILNLARQHLETGLLLKDYAEAINPDLTVNDNFPFKGELEQVLKEAADDIEEYTRELEAEEQEVTASRAEKLEIAKEARINAIEAGAIMTLNNHLATFSTKELAQAFTSQRVFYVEDIGKEAEQFDEQGQLQAKLELTELVEIHSAFLMFFCTALKKKLQDEKGEKIQLEGKDASVKLFLPEMAKQLGLDPRKYSTLREGTEDIKQLRLQMFKDKILPFEKFVGALPDGSFYRVLLFKGYDAFTDCITVEAPYTYKLLELISDRNYKLSMHELFHSSVANEPSHALELAARILAGIKQRGLRTKEKKALTKRTIKDKKTGKTITEYYQQPTQPEAETTEQPIIYRVNWQELILSCPQLTAKLNAVMASDRKKKAPAFNKIIADTVATAYRIIMKKTDAPKYYLDLKFEPCYSEGDIIPPTKSKIDTAILTVKHKGKNPNYSPSNNL